MSINLTPLEFGYSCTLNVTNNRRSQTHLICPDKTWIIQVRVTIQGVVAISHNLNKYPVLHKETKMLQEEKEMKICKDHWNNSQRKIRKCEVTCKENELTDQTICWKIGASLLVWAHPMLSRFIISFQCVFAFYVTKMHCML